MLPPDGELRVLLVWEAPIDDSDPALKIDSDEVMSSREVAAGRRKRRSAEYEADGRRYRSFRHRIVIRELPIELKKRSLG